MYEAFEDLSVEDQAMLLDPKYGNRMVHIVNAYRSMHQEVFHVGACSWKGSAVSDMLVCEHGYRIYNTLVARAMGAVNN